MWEVDDSGCEAGLWSLLGSPPSHHQWPLSAPQHMCEGVPDRTARHSLSHLEAGKVDAGREFRALLKHPPQQRLVAGVNVVELNPP